MFDYADVITPGEVAGFLAEAKTDDICVLDVRQQCNFTDYMILATGRSHRHINAAARGLAYQVCWAALVVW